MVDMKTEKEIREQLKRIEGNILIFTQSPTDLEKRHREELQNQAMALKWVLEDD